MDRYVKSGRNGGTILMKKFISILLTLSVICSLVIVPAMSVSAAETVLFDEAKNVTCVDYADLSDVSDDEITALNLSSNIGTVKWVKGTSAATGTPSMILDKENNKLTVQVNQGNYYSGSVEFRPTTVSTDAAKTVMTFKYKPYILDVNGEVLSANNSSTNLNFAAIAQKADGTEVKQRSVVYQFDGGYGRGTGVGGAYPANTVSNQPTADKEGFYYVKLVSYKNSAGTQYSYMYDMNNDEKYVFEHHFSSTHANAADTLGYGFTIDFNRSSTHTQTIMGLEMKDIEMHYEFNAIGSVTSNGTNSSHTYDEEKDEYRTVNLPVGSASVAWTKFLAGTAQTTGTVEIDLAVKNEGTVDNETAQGGTGATGGAKRRYLATADLNYLFEFSGLGTTTVKVGAFNTDNFAYNPHTGGISTSSTTYTLVENEEGYFELKIVATCSEEDGTWSYALYDKNNATYGITTPLLVKRTTNTQFKGIATHRYLENDGRKACTTGDTSLPRVTVPITIKNLDMKKIDGYSDYTLYRDSSVRGADPKSGQSTTYSGFNVVDDETVRYDCMLYTQKESGVKLIFAAYDADGNEVASVTKNLGYGLYEYNPDNQLTLTVPDSSLIDSAKLFVYDGTEWITSDGAYVPGNTSFDWSAEYGYAENGAELRSLRFYFIPSFKTTKDITDFGAYIVPFAIFDPTDVTSISSELVKGNEAIDDGETFAVQLDDIPTEYENEPVAAIPFIAIDNEYVWGNRIDVVPAEVIIP